MFQSRNRDAFGLDMSHPSGCDTNSSSFQSRNRDAFGLDATISFLTALDGYRFNLAIEMLLVWTATV